jgi:hypothetical protein
MIEGADSICDIDVGRRWPAPKFIRPRFFQPCQDCLHELEWTMFEFGERRNVRGTQVLIKSQYNYGECEYFYIPKREFDTLCAQTGQRNEAVEICPHLALESRASTTVPCDR